MAKVKNGKDVIVSFSPEEFIKSSLETDIGVVSGATVLQMFVQQKLKKTPHGVRIKNLPWVKTSFDGENFQVTYAEKIEEL